MRSIAAVLLACVLAGTAAAATITGTSRSDRLTGSRAADVLDGLDGDDVLFGGAGDDLLRGGGGRDTLDGGTGADRLVTHGDGERDDVRCGAGVDVVNAELGDVVDPDCEVVSRQLSRDSDVDFRAQHATQVEPSSFAYGSTIVVAFQSGRYVTGGAARIGWATSKDGGRTWRSGFLPGLTVFSSPAGALDVATDPVVAYDAEHGLWLIATLGRAGENGGSLLVSRSADGVTWGAPITAVSAGSGDVDKEWIACDNWPSSRFGGRCYLSYLDVDGRAILTRRSLDGGLTWSDPVAPPAGPASGRVANGAQPLVRPDGSLTVVYVSLYGKTEAEDQILAVRSTDGGVTFTPAYAISNLFFESSAGVRSDPLPSAAVDGSGRLYAAWEDCRFNEGCENNRIVVSTSRDGSSWTPPDPVSPLLPGSDAFLPGLAADPLTGRQKARLAVTFHTVLHDCWVEPACPGVDVWLASSANAGATWSRPQRLSAESIDLAWIAESGSGRFLGDYVSTSFVNGRAIPVFALATVPESEGFRQATFARVPPTSRSRR